MRLESALTKTVGIFRCYAKSDDVQYAVFKKCLLSEEETKWSVTL